ncbi:MAG: SUMF1/EgtB/PvdO family nonheme iron enzyme [bacterium]
MNDWYAVDYYTTGGPPWTDPQGAGTGSNRVWRGGSWYNLATKSRASDRNSNSPPAANNYLGFRCAQD